MRCFGVLLCLGLLGCSGSGSEFDEPLEPSNAGTGGEVVAAGTGGSDAGVGGAETAGKGGAGGSQVTAGRGGNAGAPAAGSGGAGAMAGQGGAAMAGSGGSAGELFGGAGSGGSNAGMGGTDSAGTGGTAANAGRGGAGGGSAGEAAGMAGVGGSEPSLDPQPAANCPGFVDYYVPVGTCIWFQGEWEDQTLECDLLGGGERTGCATVTARDVGPQTRRLKPGEQFMEPKRFDLVDGKCPKVCVAE
jgi:hypothetical protein